MGGSLGKCFVAERAGFNLGEDYLLSAKVTESLPQGIKNYFSTYR